MIVVYRLMNMLPKYLVKFLSRIQLIFLSRPNLIWSNPSLQLFTPSHSLLLIILPTNFFFFCICVFVHHLAVYINVSVYVVISCSVRMQSIEYSIQCVM